MAFDRELFAEFLASMCPDDALDTDLLSIGSTYAASCVERVLPDLREEVERTVYSPYPDSARIVRREAVARSAMMEGRRIRNEWLAEHGALR